MKDLLLDSTGDLVLTNFDLQLADGVDAIKQRIRRKLLCFQGEWYLDEEVGTPYFPIISSKDTEAIFQMLRQSVLEVEGVQEIITFNADINSETRNAKIAIEVTTTEGQTVIDNIELNI